MRFIIRLYFQELHDCYELPESTSVCSSDVNKISTLYGHAVTEQCSRRSNNIMQVGAERDKRFIFSLQN